ncbi:MAG: adenylate/guanylate cyclase domain-containing protein [Bacteroidota bacterium]
MQNSSTMFNIHYTGIHQKVECAADGGSLLDISLDNQIPHLHECGGNGQCTTCRVRIIDGQQNVSKRTAVERQLAKARRWDPSIRLACQCYPKGDVSVQRLVWTSSEINKLQLETVPEGQAQERPIAILFCDLRNFTSITSRNLAFDMAHMLNHFYTALGEPILMNNGIIYQYVGDEIIGIFGTSGGTRQKNCRDAVRAALGMRYALARLNRMELQDFDTEFKMGIGIHFGRAFIGHLGHPKHRQFAVIGDPVNVSSRIQGCTKTTGTQVLLSQQIVDAIPDEELQTGQRFELQLNGKTELSVLHELIGFSDVDIQLELQSSLDEILRNEEVFAQKFYARVFTEAPMVRQLFKRNMLDQGRMLTHMLSGIVYALSRPEYLLMGLKALGRSHERYGVRAEYYPIVLRCLLATIKEEMGEHYEERIGEAWRQGLGEVMRLMQGKEEHIRK